MAVRAALQQVAHVRAWFPNVASPITQRQGVKREVVFLEDDQQTLRALLGDDRRLVRLCVRQDQRLPIDRATRGNRDRATGSPRGDGCSPRSLIPSRGVCVSRRFLLRRRRCASTRLRLRLVP